MKKYKSKLPGTTKMLTAVKIMPPHYHTVPGEKFNFDNSEVVNWLLEQDGVKNFIFSKMKEYGLIVYDPNRGMWQGIDYVKHDGSFSSGNECCSWGKSYD